MGEEIYPVIEWLGADDVRLLASFTSLDDALDYCDYLMTIDRKAWVDGHQEPAYAQYFAEDE